MSEVTHTVARLAEKFSVPEDRAFRHRERRFRVLGVTCTECGQGIEEPKWSAEWHGYACDSCHEAFVERRRQAHAWEREKRILMIDTPEGQREQGIDREFWGASFADFPKMEKVMRGFCAGDPILLTLSGQCGRGKTRLLHAIQRWAYVAGRPCRYHVVDEITNRQFTEANELVESLIELNGCLLLDELGAGDPQEFALRRVERLVDARKRAGRSTAIGTNLGIEEISDAVSHRIASRMGDGHDARFIVLDGPDYRLGREG